MHGDYYRTSKKGDIFESVTMEPRWYLGWVWRFGNWLEGVAYLGAKEQVIRYRIISENGAMEKVDE